MPELTIHVPSNIGPSYMDWENCEWVQGITWQDIEMQLAWAEMIGEPADSILLSMGACDGGSTLEGFNIYNNLRGLGLPIRTHITGYAASMAVPLALAADELPEMDYLAQLMLHRASFSSGVSAETSEALRAQADRLDNTNQLLFDLLTARTGQPAEVVNGWLAPGKDTWLTATQAKAVGLAGKVNPLPANTTAVEADTLITARRQRTAKTVARADRRAAIPAQPAALPAQPAAPMATTAKKPTPRPAAPVAQKKPAAPAAKTTAPPQARKGIIQQLKELFAGLEESETTAAAGTEEPTAELQSTELSNGAKVYHDGPLAVDVAVFNNEELTEATEDGDYDTADGQVLSIAAGICTALEAGDESEATTTAVAALRQELAGLKAQIGTVTAENERLKKAKPGLPAPVSRVRTDAPDAKGARRGQPAANADAGTL